MDEWGLRLLSQCRHSLVKALTNGSRIRILVGSQCLGGENLFLLPESLEVRVSASEHTINNLLIIDSAHLVSIDSSNGKAALFSSQDSFGAHQLKNFENEWHRAAELKHFSDANPALSAAAVELTRAIENGLAVKMLEYAVTTGSTEMPAELVDVIDQKYGMKLGSMSPTQVMDLVDAALRISCLGGLRHDRANNIVSLHSKVDSKHALPWALVLASYFRKSGNEARIMQQGGGKNLQLVHLKLAAPLQT